MGSLVRTTEFLVAASMSENTRRAYRGALRAIDAWLAGRELDDALLATYLAALFDTGRAYASATMCLCAVRKRAAWYDLPDPAGKITKATLAGYRRKAVGRGRGQARGLRYADVMRILDACEVRDAAIIVLLWCGAMRVSEVAALRAEDVEDVDGGVVITIRTSKTDVNGAGLVRFIKDPYAEMIRIVAVEGRVIGLGVRQISNRVKAACREAGLEGKYSCHSGRVGFAQELTARGAPTHSIMNAGGWRSDSMVAHYSKEIAATQGAVAKFL